MDAERARDIVMAELSLLVADAAQHNSTIPVELEATLTLHANPECGMTEEEIAAELIKLAREQNVAVT